TRWYLKLASVVVEFFFGEAAYAMEDSLKHLRKWRFIIACLPLISLALLVTAATKWPKGGEDDSTSYYEGQVLRDRATILESKVQKIYVEQERQQRLLDRALDAVASVQSDVKLINQKFDLVGFLAGSAVVAILGASAMYFYNIK